MFRITASVEWIDETVCVTHVSGHNLPDSAIEPLMEWALALELGCGIEELPLLGWEPRPEGPEQADPDEWVLDWNTDTPPQEVTRAVDLLRDRQRGER